MCTQYKDETFGETRPLPEAFEEFFNAVEADTAKSFHVGTPEEIEQVKCEKSNAVNIKKLEDELSDLKATMNINKVLHIPTNEEIEAICGKE